ncbi:MAG: tyrosine-type recombinase/integrase [Pseudonocardiaceae bacterium]
MSNRLLAVNPCEDIRLPPRRKHDADERIITREELVAVLLPIAPDRYRAIVATAGGAGLRWGEAAGLCAGALNLDQRRLRVISTVATGATLAKEFPAEREAVLHIARSCAGGLRFHDLRHSYATWLVDDGVPPNMVARVMGHEKITTTLQLYTRRTDDESRILDALTDEPGEGDDS